MLCHWAKPAASLTPSTIRIEVKLHNQKSIRIISSFLYKGREVNSVSKQNHRGQDYCQSTQEVVPNRKPTGGHLLLCHVRLIQQLHALLVVQLVVQKFKSAFQFLFAFRLYFNDKLRLIVVKPIPYHFLEFVLQLDLQRPLGTYFDSLGFGVFSELHKLGAHEEVEVEVEIVLFCVLEVDEFVLWGESDDNL